MAKIVTLKKNNEVIYPVTKAEAVVGGGASYDASWLAAAPPVVATAEQADALCQAISDGIPIYLRYEDVPQGDPYITYATDASTTGGEPVVTFLTGALNGAKTARTYTISRGGMGVQGSVFSYTTTLIDTQTGKVTASNIDWATSWKVIATSSEATVSIPLDYRLYRIRLISTKTSSASWGEITCPEATGTTYIWVQGVSNGTTVHAERSLDASSDKAVMDGARGAVPAGFQAWDITLSRASTSATQIMAMWQVSQNNSLTYNTGRSTFNVSGNSVTLRRSGASGHYWVVEAFIEA